MSDKTLDILLAHRKEPKELTNTELKKRFKFLGKTHKLIKSPMGLELGNIINHISYSSETNTLSPPGIIHNIEYHCDQNNNRSIKKIKLVNTYLGIFWEINMMTKKYYLFESLNVEPQLFDTDLLLKCYDTKKLTESSNDINSHSTENMSEYTDDMDNFWEEQLAIYNKK